MEILKQSSQTRDDLGLLAVMEALENRENTTQRELAKETGLNLKKVNYCLHKLLEKGYVKFQRVRQNPDKRAYLYILTPAGMKMKSQLTYGFLRFTLDFYSRVESKLRDCIRSMAADGVRNVLLYGASDIVRILVGVESELADIRLVGVVDDKTDGQDCFGLPVRRKAQLSGLEFDAVLITDLENLDDSEHQLIDVGVEERLIWKLS